MNLNYLAHLLSFTLFFVTGFATAKPQEQAWGIAQIRASLTSNNKIITGKQNHSDLSKLLVAINQHQQLMIYDTTLGKPVFQLDSNTALGQKVLVSADKKYAYFSSNEGWVSRFDLQHLQVTERIRVGLNTRNLAMSSDGRYLIAANNQPNSLVILEAKNLQALKVISLAETLPASKIASGVFDVAMRESFIVTIQQANNAQTNEVWEILYKDNPLPVYNGPMHDYRMGEGIAKQEKKFPISRIQLENCTGNCLKDWFIYPASGLLILHTDKQLQVIQLDVRRKIAEMDLPVVPTLAISSIWDNGKGLTLATPGKNTAELIIINASHWKVIKRLKTLGIVSILASRANSPYIWLAEKLDSNQDTIQIVNKKTLQIIKTIKPATPDSKINFIQFGKSGKQVYVGSGKDSINSYHSSGSEN
jgi:hypothetical protein